MMAAHAQSVPVFFTIVLSAASFQYIGARFYAITYYACMALLSLDDLTRSRYSFAVLPISILSSSPIMLSAFP